MAPRITMPMTPMRSGAEGHADADLRRAAHDGVSGDAVEADGGQQQREGAEEHGEPRDHALLGEAVGDLLVEGLELHDGEVGIDAGERALRRASPCRSWGGRSG